MDKIRKMSINYIRQGLYISAALFLLTLLVMQVWFLDLLTPAIVSVAFTLVVCGTIGIVWHYVAKNSIRFPPVVGAGSDVCLLSARQQ